MYVHRTSNIKEFSCIDKYCIQINFVFVFCDRKNITEFPQIRFPVWPFCFSQSMQISNLLVICL